MNNELTVLNKQSNSANDQCFICGNKGHFAKYCKVKSENCSRCGRKGHTLIKCYAKTTIEGKSIEKSEECIIS